MTSLSLDFLRQAKFSESQHDAFDSFAKAHSRVQSVDYHRNSSTGNHHESTASVPSMIHQNELKSCHFRQDLRGELDVKVEQVWLLNSWTMLNQTVVVHQLVNHKKLVPSLFGSQAMRAQVRRSSIAEEALETFKSTTSAEINGLRLELTSAVQALAQTGVTKLVTTGGNCEFRLLYNCLDSDLVWQYNLNFPFAGIKSRFLWWKPGPGVQAVEVIHAHSGAQLESRLQMMEQQLQSLKGECGFCGPFQQVKMIASNHDM